MIPREETSRLREELLGILAEDGANTQRLLARLESLAGEKGLTVHATLLLLLTRMPFDDDEARRHWGAIIAHRHEMSLALQREIALRVAVFDYFVNINRSVARPTLLDLAMSESGREGSPNDPLTGLYGDRAFRGAVLAELRRAKRYGQRVAVLVVDFDRFEAVNARRGSLVGDRMLKEAAMLLSNKVRDIDVAGRPGEDEFALLLPETDRNGGILVAERFRTEVKAHFGRRESGGEPVALTVSAGVAAYPDDALTAEDLLARAAQALYRAKASGGDAVHGYEPERRRFLRFDLDPGHVEVEVLGRDLGPSRTANASRNGILFSSPEPLDVGEVIEMRVGDVDDGGSGSVLRVRGHVVRLEELPADVAAREGEPPPDRFEIGVVLEPPQAGAERELLEFLERVRQRKTT